MDLSGFCLGLFTELEDQIIEAVGCYGKAGRCDLYNKRHDFLQCASTDPLVQAARHQDCKQMYPVLLVVVLLY